MTVFMELNPEQQREVMYALYRRYEYQDVNKVLIEELRWLKGIRRLMIKEEKKRLGKISGYNIRSVREPYIDKVIKNLESATA